MPSPYSKRKRPTRSRHPSSHQSNPISHQTYSKGHDLQQGRGGVLIADDAEEAGHGGLRHDDGGRSAVRGGEGGMDDDLALDAAAVDGLEYHIGGGVEAAAPDGDRLSGIGGGFAGVGRRAARRG